MMCPRRLPGVVTAFVAATLVTSCAVGPNFETPAAPDVTGYTKESLKASSASAGSGKGQGQRFAQDLDIPGQWWATFHSRPLNDLIDDALKHNPDLQAAQALGGGWWNRMDVAPNDATKPDIDAIIPIRAFTPSLGKE
jgi:hypothetical protein